MTAEVGAPVSDIGPVRLPVGRGLGSLVRDFMRRHAGDYAAAALMLALIATTIVWMPRQVGRLVDGLVSRDLHGPQLLAGVGWLVAAGLAVYGLRVAWRIRLYSASYRMGVDLRAALQARLSLQSPRFYQGRRTGELMALATNDVDAIEMAAGEAVLAGFDGSLTFALVLFAMVAGVDARLAAVAMLPFPFMAFAFWRISTRVHEHSRRALDGFAGLNDHVQETITGIRTLRALGLEGVSARRFSALAHAAGDAALRAQRWEAAYDPAIGIALSAAAALSLSYGGWLVWRDELSIGQLTSFGLYLAQLVWPMFAAGWVLSLWLRGRAAWTRLSAVLEEPLEVGDTGQVGRVTPGELVLRDVRLVYPGGGAPALDGVSLCIPPGSTLGLVGPTGSGKSSLLRLLLRQWPPAGGQILWNSVPLGDYRLSALRAAIAWVPQEPILFSTSVAENIALGSPAADRGRIEWAARLAAVHEDILRFPQGYDTLVGERGLTLSGGQRQRVAIARALLADAPLLLLDDALSAVDTETQQHILAQLRSQRTGRTVVVVSHRLSTLADADHIVVLRHGRVAESGTHGELLALGVGAGWYAQQWRIQQLEASLDAQ
jgi:ATP-binding cassette subfamily B protein/ATP-binding cassette subfamily C protein/ATP-binding cassette subfamily B multidrug efflux pump